MNVGDMYLDGEYLKNNPTWDAEDAPWKSDLILGTLQKNHIDPMTVCEVGCGSGEILRQLQIRMPAHVMFTGYEISPQAIELCRQRENERLNFYLKNFTDEPEVHYDLILLIDLIEHLDDYFRFLKDLRGKSEYIILHIPLEMFALAVLYPAFHLGQRKKVGHLHFFTKELALDALRRTGYEILDFRYTAGFALPRNNGIKDKILKVPRKVLFPVVPDFTARTFGGYSLLVLVK